MHSLQCVSLSCTNRLTSVTRETPRECDDISVRRNAALRSHQFVTSIFMTLWFVEYRPLSGRFGYHFDVACQSQLRAHHGCTV